MSFVIAKSPQDDSGFIRPFFTFDSAREAFKAFLRSADLKKGQKVLIPAYIGWSPREGSGVFDPIKELGLEPVFYAMHGDLRIDLASFRQMLLDEPVGVVVLIHYFGYVDPSYEQVAAIARDAGALILEDEAHAMFTDLVGGGCGRLGDACIFSLHKMLPMSTGGMLVYNGAPKSAPTDTVPLRGVSPWQYDLFGIAARRRENAKLLTELLSKSVCDGIRPLWPELQPFEVPQTYPVLVQGVSRFDLYTMMNDAGFGVVSLYHTLIDMLPRERFPASHALADTILNLPVHQDVGEAELRSLVQRLGSAIGSLREQAQLA